MQKQAACAAAISSSGLVVDTPSRLVRASQLTGISGAALLLIRTRPLPSARLPCHVACALLAALIAIFSTSLSESSYYRRPQRSGAAAFGREPSRKSKAIQEPKGVHDPVACIIIEQHPPTIAVS